MEFYMKREYKLFLKDIIENEQNIPIVVSNAILAMNNLKL